MEKLYCYQKPRAKNQSQGLPVEEIILDFIKECEIPLMEVDSNTDVELIFWYWFLRFITIRKETLQH